MTCKPLAAAGLAVCLVLFLASSVQGQPTATSCADIPGCAERFKEAQRLSKSGATELALQRFQELDHQYSEPTVLYPIAVMLDRLGRFAEAAAAYQHYLDSGAESDPALLAKVQEQLRLAQEKATPPPPVLVVEKKPPETSAGGVVVIPPNPPLDRKPAVPIYKRAWFWAVLGGSVAAAALGVGLGVGLGTRGPRLPDGVNTYVATF